MQRVIHLGFLALVMISNCQAFGSILGPSSYQSFSDSPFASIGFSQFYLEDFEDNSLNVPGATASSGIVLNFGTLRDSVDEDDGAIDGSGLAGYSWYVTQPTFSLTFDANVLGSLPTHAGMVLTDIGFLEGLHDLNAPTVGLGEVTFEAFDAANASLGLIGPVDFGDGKADGNSAEDRFFGAINPGGISKISFYLNSDDWELDHLQYGIAAAVGMSSGSSVPELSSRMTWGFGVLAVSLGTLLRRRRVGVD